MDIKDIIEMWDDIDALTVDVVVAIARRAGHDVDLEYIQDKMYDRGFHADLRDSIIAFLGALGYGFVAPECDY